MVVSSVGLALVEGADGQRVDSEDGEQASEVRLQGRSRFGSLCGDDEFEEIDEEDSESAFAFGDEESEDLLINLLCVLRGRVLVVAAVVDVVVGLFFLFPFQ